MIALLRSALLKRGLKLHPSKCKAQTNVMRCTLRGQVLVDDSFAVEILPEGTSLRILGADLELHDVSSAAIQNRVDSAWRWFWSMKRMLQNHKIV